MITRDPMEKADEKSDKLKDVRSSVKNRTFEKKQQTTSETSNLESASSSHNNLSENAQSKVNKKTSHSNKLNDSSGLESRDGPNMSGDADNDTGLRKVEELADNDVGKSSLSSDEYEDNKVSDGGSLPKEHPDEEDHADDDDEDAVEQDVKVCDICGDAGREDLLAICCRCPDGAEHTYCMKEMLEAVPEGDWVCEECILEEFKKKNRQKCGTDKDQSSDQLDSKGRPVEEIRSNRDHSVAKVSGKRRAEELETSSSAKKQALEINTGPTKDIDRGKMKPNHHSDSHHSNESQEGARSPGTRPRLQSLRGAFFKSNSFSFPNAKSKTKLVDDIVLQRQKSTKERSSHEAREMGKSTSFRSTNLGRVGPGSSKVKMLSPNSSHVQDFKSLKSIKERSFERTNSVKLQSLGNLGSSSSAVMNSKADKFSVSRGENTPVSPASNSEVKTLKGDSKMISGLKSTSRSANLAAEVSASQVNKQLPSSPTKVGTASSSGISNSSEQKSIPSKEDSSKLSISKESTNLADGTKETNTSSLLGPGQSAQVQTSDRTGSSSNNVSALRSSKDVKNRDNKLKDAIEAALLKKPGIYRKNRVSDQSDDTSVSNVNNEIANVDRIPHPRNAGNLNSAEVSTDWHVQIPRSSNVDHFKQSNGNSFKQPMIPPAEGKHLTNELSSYDAVALPNLSKNSAIPDHECIWQGSFQINRSGRTAEFWDGLQAHLSSCASPRVFETVNKLPHRILLNGVSRVSAWPSQFENSGVKEDNIAIYFFAKDLESYEKSYQVLLDDMIRGDLALIGSINGVELLIFPSNQLPEKSNRWNMLFFLWGVFRGQKKNSLHQVSNNPEKSFIPQVGSSISTVKISSAEDVSSLGSVDKDKHVESESKVNLNPQISSQEKPINLNSQISSQEKQINLNSLISSQEKPINLNSQISSQEKPINLNSQISSQEKPINLNSQISSQEKPINLNSQISSQGKPINLNSQISSQEKPINLNSQISSQQIASQEKPINNISIPLDSSNKSDSQNVTKSSRNPEIEEGSFVKEVPVEPKKRSFIDLSDDDDFTPKNQRNTWHDPNGRVAEEGTVSKKPKTDSYEHSSNGERFFFPVETTENAKKPVFELDLNEDISCLVGETDNLIVTKNDVEDNDVASLSLSLAFKPPGKDDDEDTRGKGKCHSGPSMLLFRDMVDK